MRLSFPARPREDWRLSVGDDTDLREWLSRTSTVDKVSLEQEPQPELAAEHNWLRDPVTLSTARVERRVAATHQQQPEQAQQGGAADAARRRQHLARQLFTVEEDSDTCLLEDAGADTASAAGGAEKGARAAADPEDWMSALAEAADCLQAADKCSEDAEGEIAQADAQYSGGVPSIAPPLLCADTDSDTCRVDVLMHWLRGLPEGAMALNGATIGVGRYGVGVFAAEDLPAGHVALRISTSQVVTTGQCTKWCDRYHGLGEVLAALAPRCLGDGRWSPKCSRATKMAIFLIAERALALAEASSSAPAAGPRIARNEVGGTPLSSTTQTDGAQVKESPAADLPTSPDGQTAAHSSYSSPSSSKAAAVAAAAAAVVGAPGGYVASMPGFGALTPAVSALQPKPGAAAKMTPKTAVVAPAGWRHDQRAVLSKIRAEEDDTRDAEKQLLQSANQAQHYVETELRRGPFHRYFPAEVFSSEALRWALGCVYSRGFNIDGKLVMIPLIDMLNHQSHTSSGHNTVVQYESASGELQEVVSQSSQVSSKTAVARIKSKTSRENGKGRKHREGAGRRWDTDDDQSGERLAGDGYMIARTTVAAKKGTELMVCYNRWDSKAELYAKYGIVSEE